VNTTQAGKDYGSLGVKNPQNCVKNTFYYGGPEVAALDDVFLLTFSMCTPKDAEDEVSWRCRFAFSAYL